MVNSFPAKLGVSQIHSPREIVTGQKLDVKTDLRAQFGSYVEASYDNIITNHMTDRTHRCIALGTTVNRQGSLTCFDLLTGAFDVLPILDRVVKVLNAWGKRSQEQYGNRLELRN